MRKQTAVNDQEIKYLKWLSDPKRIPKVGQSKTKKILIRFSPYWVIKAKALELDIAEICRESLAEACRQAEKSEASSPSVRLK